MFVEPVSCVLWFQHWPWSQMFGDYSIEAEITTYISEPWLPTRGPNWKHLYKPRNGNTFPYSWECLHTVEVLRAQQETVLWAADGQLKRGEIHKSRQSLFPDKLRPEVWGFETWSDGFSQSKVSSRMRQVCCEKLAEAMLRFSDMWFPVLRKKLNSRQTFRCSSSVLIAPHIHPFPHVCLSECNISQIKSVGSIKIITGFGILKSPLGVRVRCLWEYIHMYICIYSKKKTYIYILCI